jgi:hypothetical protein
MAPETLSRFFGLSLRLRTNAYLREVVADVKRHSESLIRVHIWQGEEVSTPDEEIAVMGNNGDPLTASDAHHRLEARRASQRVHQVVAKLQPVALCANSASETKVKCTLDDQRIEQLNQRVIDKNRFKM